jgi:hypothetical protein
MRLPALAGVVVLLAAVAAGDDRRAAGETSAGFGDDLLIVPTAGWRTDFSRHTVPLVQFQRTGVPKDGIPAIRRARSVPVTAADRWLGAMEPVIELVVNGEARAYPLQILVWHEIANDELGGVPVAVTFCPLCHTAIAFDRRLDGETYELAVSGTLRRSDLVMFDRETESWWQQFSGDAVVGELAGARLERLPAAIVPWEDFARRHPGGTVLSRDTGYDRPYGASPYAGYDDIGSTTLFGTPLFGTPNQGDDRVPLKERVVFVERGGEALAVPFSALEHAGRLEVRLGGDRLELAWLPGVRSAFGSLEPGGKEAGAAAVRLAGSGEPVVFDTPFWFAVAAFRPDVRVWPPSRLDTLPSATGLGSLQRLG